MLVAVIVGYHVLSRLLYAFGVGGMLMAQDRRQVFTRDVGGEEGWRRFRRRASFILNNDGVSFVVLCIVTWETMQPPFPMWFRIVAGLSLIVVGSVTKIWAAKCLGSKAYYWHNFFVPKKPERLADPGPYKYLNNPMYTVGYLHAYGAAILAGSWIGLVAAVFDQTAILLFNQIVEKPHFEMLLRLPEESSP